MEARRRVGALPTLDPTSDAAYRKLTEDLDLDPEILKIWEDFGNEPEPTLSEREKARQSGPSNNTVWSLLIVGTGILLFFANHFSNQEMHRLKSERTGDVPSVAHEGQWWYNSLIYHIFPRSFMDSNGDGIGDINGKILFTTLLCIGAPIN